jgi:hypothetical protein
MSDVETEGISQCFDTCACARGGRARPGSVRGVSRALLELRAAGAGLPLTGAIQ